MGGKTGNRSVKKIHISKVQTNALRKGRGGTSLIRPSILCDGGKGEYRSETQIQAEGNSKTLGRLIDLSIDCGLATWAGIGGHGALAYCDLIHFSTTKKSKAQKQKGRQTRRG